MICSTTRVSPPPSTFALSAHLLPRWPGYPVATEHFPGSWLLEGWVRYDGNWYRDIVNHGYAYAGPGQQANVAYFPGYPLAMGLVTLVVRNAALAGVLLTMACGLGALVLFARWTRTRVDERTNTVMVLAAIDNLVKGTAGGAIQCLNLMSGLGETTGLPMIGLAP